MDHAAQYATARSASFSALMKELETEGLVKQWPARVVALEGGAAAVPVEGDAVRYVGADGMGGIAAALARGLDVRQDVWVPPNGGITYESDGMWRLRLPSGAGDDCRFDAVVIAHNGKCAERLTSSVPARDVHSLLRTRFAASLPGGGREGGGVFTLNSVYSLAFEAPAGVMPSDFDAAEVRGGPLRWLANNAAKYAPADGGGEVWTAMSTGAFGKAHKVPQEQLAGTEAEAEVTAKLLRAVEAAVGLEPEALKPLRTRLQLWGAALPLCRWDDPYVWDAEHRIGIAGDWCAASAEHAATVEGAFLSGEALANHLAATPAQPAGLSLGADGGRFVPIEGAFGGAPGQPSWVQPAEAGGGRGGGRGGGGRGGGGGGGKRYFAQRLFVHNLPYEWGEARLVDEIEACAGRRSVSAAQVLTSADGLSRGMAKVRMETAEAASEAVRSLDGKTLGGRALRVSLEERRDGGGGGVGRGGGRGRGNGGGRAGRRGGRA